MDTLLTGARSVYFALDVGHTRLVAKEGSQMDGLGGVILGESLALSSDAHTSLLGEETQRAMAWC